MFAALIMCTMFLTQTSWKRLTFYKCYGRKFFDLNSGFFNHGFIFLSPPEGGLDLVTNRKGAIYFSEPPRGGTGFSN